MTKTKDLIQRVELSTYGQALHCPFCGALAQRSDDDIDPTAEFELPPLCEHVLFVAHDMGFEYRAERFNQLMKLEPGTENEDIETPEKGFDGLTDMVAMAGAVKFASYQGAPSFFGVYVGFAPTGD
jgi:hypothetical protein